MIFHMREHAPCPPAALFRVEQAHCARRLRRRFIGGLSWLAFKSSMRNCRRQRFARPFEHASPSPAVLPQPVLQQPQSAGGGALLHDPGHDRRSNLADCLCSRLGSRRIFLLSIGGAHLQSHAWLCAAPCELDAGRSKTETGIPFDPPLHNSGPDMRSGIQHAVKPPSIGRLTPDIIDGAVAEQEDDRRGDLVLGRPAAQRHLVRNGSPMSGRPSRRRTSASSPPWG